MHFPGKDEMSNLPSLSIVTVCKNAAATIAMTIDSVLSQQVGGVEYIVIDGSSTDATLTVIRSYGDSIDKFTSEPDDGIADAFNKGIAMATGDIVGIINADDFLLPGALRRVCDYFAVHPDVEVLHGDVMLYQGNRLIKRVRPSGRWWYPWRLVLFNHPATFVRRRVYEQYGFFDTSYEIAMDVEIFLRWLRERVKVVYVPDSLVSMQAGGLSGRRAFHGYREVKRALLAHKFPKFLADIQYVARFGVQFVVSAQEKLRTLKRGT
ncbi:MAG: glycosyltransferase [Deltaproteobacteria bacterium]|nr:glycosyltransferase [Deltaproteobacteria bacterium]